MWIDAYHDLISILLDLKSLVPELWLLAKLKFEFIIRIFFLKIKLNLKQIRMPSLIVVGKVTHSVFIKITISDWFLWFLTNWIRTGYGDGKLCDNVITNVVGNSQGNGQESDQLWICGSNSRNPLLYQISFENNFHRKEYPALDFCPKSFNINRHGFVIFGHQKWCNHPTTIIRTWPQTCVLTSFWPQFEHGS